MAMFFKGGGKIGQPNWLRPNGSLIKIPNGGLNEKDFHIFKRIREIILNQRSVVHL